MFDHPQYVAWAAVLVAVAWVILAVLGDQPNGAILGFAGTLLMVSGMQVQQQKIRNERDQRPPPPVEPPSSQEVED